MPLHDSTLRPMPRRAWVVLGVIPLIALVLLVVFRPGAVDDATTPLETEEISDRTEQASSDAGTSSPPGGTRAELTSARSNRHEVPRSESLEDTATDASVLAQDDSTGDSVARSQDRFDVGTDVPSIVTPGDQREATRGAGADDADATSGRRPSRVAPERVVPLTDPIPPVRLQKVFTADSWKRPVQIVARPDDADLLVILEQGGRIRTVRQSTPTEASTPFVDLSDRVSFGTNEEGLLSLAFHPKFTENLEFFVYYSAASPRRSVLSRMKAVREGDAIIGDPASEQVLLEVPQPYWNHNGGTALFGPDGMLYLSLGDGGAAGDPKNSGQDLSSLLGKVIRIDVNLSGTATAYAIPPDNPLVDRRGARPEIWAWGLRNVWRMSFDRETDVLWAGDVGQNAWEEINVIVRGGNYGWRLREGRRAFARGGEQRGEMIDPVIEYPHRDGLSVTGGHVYRGSRTPEWQGVYFFADYNYGRIWGARVGRDTEGTVAVGPVRDLGREGGLMISSFGETLDGELYFCGFDGGERGPGVIHRVLPRRAGG